MRASPAPVDEASADEARANAARRDAEDEAAEGDDGTDGHDISEGAHPPNAGANRTARPRLNSRMQLALKLASPEGRLLDVGTLELTPERYVFGQLVRVVRNGRPTAVPQLSADGSGAPAMSAVAAADAEGAVARKLSPLEELANALRVPARGVCFVAAGAYTGGRYTNNIYHQAEYVWPMVDNAISEARAPATVLWPFALLPWSRQVLELLLPLTDVVAAPEATASLQQVRCASESIPFKAVGSGGGRAGYWSDPRSPGMARKLMMRRCRRPLRNVSATPLVVLLERGGLDDALLRASSTGGPVPRKRRRIANREAVLALLRAAMPAARVELRYSPAAEVPLCEQLDVFSGASVVLTPHGAQLNNAVFAAPRTTVVEAMPWAKRQYPGHVAMLRYSGLVHTRVHSMRPPAEDAQWGNGQYTEEQCEAIELCTRFYRDFAEIHLHPRELHGALAASVAEQPAMVGVAQLQVQPWPLVKRALEEAGFRPAGGGRAGSVGASSAGGATSTLDGGQMTM